MIRRLAIIAILLQVAAGVGLTWQAIETREWWLTAFVVMAIENVCNLVRRELDYENGE